MVTDASAFTVGEAKTLTFTGSGREYFGIWFVNFTWSVRSLMFRLNTTSYRSLRFAFRGSTVQAYWVFLALPVLSVVTLLVMAPFCHQRIKRYQIAHAAWGSTPFRFGAPVGGFYRIYFGTLGLLLALSIAALIAMGVLAVGLGAGPGNGPRPIGLLFARLAVYGAIAIAVRAFFDARVRALVWGHTWVGDHRIVCFIEPKELFFLTATNLIATLLTLGLYLPFAQIRMARYLATVAYVIPGGSIDGVAATEDQAAGAVGEESAGIFDFDIGM